MNDPETGVIFQPGSEILIFLPVFRLPLEPLLASHPPEVMKLESKPDHSPPTSVKVKVKLPCA
jgi:hypothetical protein